MLLDSVTTLPVDKLQLGVYSVSHFKRFMAQKQKRVNNEARLKAMGLQFNPDECTVGEITF